MTTSEDNRADREDRKADLREDRRVITGASLRNRESAVQGRRAVKQEGRSLLVPVRLRTDALKRQAKSLLRDLSLRNILSTSLSTTVMKY